MKKIFVAIFTTILFVMLLGCSKNETIEFKEFYSEVIGFSKNYETAKLVPQDTFLMMTNEEFQKFKDKYFTPREIPIKSPDKDKAVLYIQISSKTSSVNMYSVQSTAVQNNTLTVSLKKSGVAKVDAVEGFNGTWKWVMFVEIDKTYLKDNMKVVIKK